jgi:hypothetical protein
MNRCADLLYPWNVGPHHPMTLNGFQDKCCRPSDFDKKTTHERLTSYWRRGVAVPRQLPVRCVPWLCRYLFSFDHYKRRAAGARHSRFQSVSWLPSLHVLTSDDFGDDKQAGIEARRRQTKTLRNPLKRCHDYTTIWGLHREICPRQWQSVPNPRKLYSQLPLEHEARCLIKGIWHTYLLCSS